MYHSRFFQKLHISDKRGLDELIIIMRQPCEMCGDVRYLEIISYIYGA